MRLFANIALCIVCSVFVGFSGCGHHHHGPGPEPLEDISPLTFAVVVDQSYNDSDDDGTIRMVDTVSEYLGRYLRMMADPEQADVKVYLWAKSKRVEDPVRGPMWFATVGTSGVRVATGREHWRFQMKSGDRSGSTTIRPVATRVIGEEEARLQAIEKVAAPVARRIIKEVRHSKGTGSASRYHYTFSFAGFSSSELQTIRTAMLSMQTGKNPFFKLEGGEDLGSKATYRVKWLHTENSQEEAMQIVKETVRSRGVLLEITQYSPGLITLQPSSY